MFSDLRFTENQMFEKKHPYQIDPSEDEPDANAEHYADDVTKAGLFKNRTDADDDLGHPVHTGDEQ